MNWFSVDFVDPASIRAEVEEKRAAIKRFCRTEGARPDGPGCNPKCPLVRNPGHFPCHEGASYADVLRNYEILSTQGEAHEKREGREGG